MNNTFEYFIQNLKGSDLESFYNVINAYKEIGSPEIMYEGVGFNQNSGYVYIALENGIQIASCFGQSVDYIVYDFNDGEEYFFDNYEEAEKLLETL
jgi:hypothetical protein